MSAKHVETVPGTCLIGTLTSQKIFVEPIPRLFAQLSENVQKAGLDHVLLENAAIGTQSGSATMYCWDLDRLADLELPGWFTQICSFDRDRLYKSKFDTAPALKRNKHVVAMEGPEEFANKYIKSLLINILCNCPLRKTPSEQGS